MPKYVLNGKTYNIPDSLTQKFESENPNATIGYTAGGKHYNIPVSKRDKFLKAFPDATTGEQKKAETQAQMPKQQPAQAAPAQPTEQAAATQQPTQPQKTQEPQQQKPNEPYKPTEQEMMGFGMTMNHAQYAADNATKGIDGIEQNAQKASPFGSGNVGITNNKNLRKGEKKFNAESGQFEDSYLTTDGQEYTDVAKANAVQQNIDEVMAYNHYKEVMKAYGIDDVVGENKKSPAELLKEAQAERDQILRIMDSDKDGKDALRDVIMSGGYDPTPNAKLEERENYQVALRMLDRRIKALEVARDNGNVRGVTDVLFDPSSYSFGLTDLQDSKQMSRLNEKIKSGALLTSGEQALARNYLMNQAAQSLNADNDWYQFWQGFGQTLSFMKDFAVTGGGFASLAKGGMALGGKMGAKAAATALGKDYLTKNLGTKLLGKAITTTGKGAGLLVGSELGGMALNNTVQLASSMADINNKRIGELTIGKDGNLTFENSQSLAKAALQSQTQRIGENASELVGVAFDAVPGILGKVIQRTPVGKVLNKMVENKFWKGFEKGLNYLGVQSVWGEGMEEEYGMMRTAILNAITDGQYDPNAESILDLDTQLRTWETVGITSMLLRVPAMTVSGVKTAEYYGNKYNLNAADRNMRSVFGDYERYNAVKSMIDGAENANIDIVVGNLLKNGQLSADEKQAMFLYANDLIKLRGFNIADIVAAANGYTEPPRVADYRRNGLHVDEVDKDGNILNSYDFETEDALKAGLYEMQQKRFDDTLHADLSVMRARPMGSFELEKMAMDYAVDNGIDNYEDVLAALDKPSMERTEAEQQMIAPFADMLHNVVYDNTMLHEEQSQQDGEDLADSDSIDLEQDNQQGVALKAQWDQAQANRQQLFDKNEVLREEVENMEKNEKLSPQEILSRIESSARPDEVQGMIDYYNTKAKYEGYMNRKAQKINEEAANSRERHTFKGTIDGKADLNGVHLITDGTNEYYLVSGDVTTDPATGRITGSTSGLIIGMDLDGSFVQLNESDGYSVEPVTMTLDQFEEAERIRLQQQVSATIDPNGAAAAQQGGAENSVGNGNEVRAGRTGSPTGTENNGEGEAAAPATPTQPVNPPSPAGGNNQSENIPGQGNIPTGNIPQQPSVSIESVTDKDGIKRYENGIAVDDAIADIITDGFDVGEVADASIAEAQQVIDKINGKATKTRKDLMDKKKAQDVIDYYTQVKTRWNEVNREENVNNEPQQPQNEGNVVPSQPKLTVEEQKQERIKALKAELGELFDDDFTKANDVYELVSMWVGRKRNLAWDDVNGKRGLQKELGWTRKIGGDTKFIETLLAKKGEGVGVDEFVHMVWESPENTIGEEKRWSTEEIKEALLDLLKSAQSKSDVVDYALNTREAQARQALAEQQKQAEEEAANQAEPEIVLTDEDLARIQSTLPFDMPVEGEDIPENPTNALFAVIREVSQEGNMPAINVVDTDRMTDSDWADFASEVYGGAFLSEEDVNAVRDYAMEHGVVWDDATGTIQVFTGAVTPELLREKLEQLKNEYNGAEGQTEVDGSSESSRNTDNAGVRNENENGEEPATPAAEGAESAESTGSSESVDDYLQPRNAEEEAIIQNVVNQLQREIQTAVDEQNKARSELQKAQARESERATDLFGNDNALNQPGQLFDNSDMPVDQSKEGVERRTEAERQRLQEATNKLNQLQSIEERNSRIRGALDNHRRQTQIDLGAEPQGTVQSREEYLASHPLTEEQIMADTETTEDEKLNAIDFLRGEDDSAISRFYYDGIYNRVAAQPQRTEQESAEPQQPQSKWQYQFHYDKETGRAWITRDDWSGGIPIEDGRFRIEGKNLAELRAILENPKNNLGELLNEVEAQLHNAEVGEQLRRESNPMDAIEQAASSFREEREQQKSQDQQDIDDALKEFNDFLDNAKGSGVLDKFMRKGLEGNDKAQANLFDAFTLTNEAQRMFLKDLLRLASKVGYAYIKSGVHDVQAWSKQMSETIGQKLREVLGWDDTIVSEFVDEVWNQKYTVDGQRMRLSEHAERLKNQNPTDQSVNEHKEKNNEPENVVSSQQKPASELEGDAAEFAERQEKMKRLNLIVHDILLQATLRGGEPAYDYETLGHVSLKTIGGVKRLADNLGLKDLSLTDLQELVEAQIVQVAREISETESLNDEQKFQNIVRLYQIQPTLSARDNDRINKQQYSTPAPMAYLMGRFVKGGRDYLPFKKECLEPSAGNGMLTIGLPKEQTRVNDIDEMRLSNLAKQGFLEVTNQDGLQSFGEKQYDVVVTNPPFGSTAPKVYNGLYEISGLEHQMAINALESMQDDGRAAIIIGGNTEYNQNGTIKGKDRAFLNYLYAHYNVVDVINMNGHELYSRQGTGFPVRMILINGRKEFNPRNFAPVIQKARAERVNNYDELYKRVNDDILSDENKPAGVHDTESGEGRRVDDNSNAGNTTQTGVRNVRPEGSSRQSGTDTQSGSSVSRRNSSTNGRTKTEANPSMGGGLFDVGGGAETSEPSRSTAEQAGEQRAESGRNDSERPSASVDNSVGLGQRGAGTAQQPEQPAVKRGLGTEKVPYRKQSGNPFTLQSLMPAEQADVVKKALEELGDVDQFLVDELGYSSKEELHQALAAEQIDSVAMAISQMNQGSAFIIGDQTGIGKGRQAAALIRYGVKKGGFPVFITVKKALFSDMYRDLCDIGSPKLRPFIWSADDTEHSGNVTDKNGRVVYQTPSAKEQKRVVDYINKNGKLPPEYDYVLTTYDSFKSGTMDYENGEKKARSFGKKQPGPVHYNGQAKRDALEKLSGNSYVIMDESHNAGGEGSNVSNYLQYITTKAKGLTFLSATFAKRPGNMPIYSLKTAISKAGVKVEELIDAVKRGGATFQEIMSKALTEAGQMIRRERDMTGVTIDWRGIEDEAVVQKQREQYDTVIGLFNDIIQFQRAYVDPIVNGMNDAAAEEQGEVDHTPGTRDMGINNTPFASRTYNMVQQVLLSLKAEEAAKRAIEHLKAGRKPVITVANTNEGAADEAAGMGDSMEMPDLSVNLKKGLQGTMRITKKDAFGNSTNEMIPFERLSEEGRKRYHEIMDAIENASSGLSLSPIDVIKNTLQKAGYKVGELTGRKAEFIYNEDGTVRRVKRQDTDKKRIAADFNNGKLDALILNRSAGTGISLHASSKFDDQRQRIMIVAQAQGDVNDEVQIRGRIDRTGQVLRGMYEYVVSQIPSEQRLLMMLKAKLRSLDANTTSSQKSKFNEMQVQDIINKYGDEIVIQYLAEHPDLAMKMCDPLKWGEGAETLAPETLISQAQKPSNGGDGATASKVLGRMALLKVAEQEKMLAELGDLYQAEIDRLNEMGENDLEITEMPLKAKTLSKEVWEEGVEPGGKNPFADNSYVETVEMDVLKKPMKAEEVKKAQARMLGGKTWEEYKQGVMEKVDAWAEQKKADTTQTFTERAEKKATAEQEKYVKGAKKMQDKNGMTDAEIERNGKSQYDTIFKQEMEKLQPALEAVDNQKQAFVDALETFTTDGVYALPTDIYDLGQLTFEPSFGKVIDINIKEDNFSTTASTITFATMDGRRKITIPISGMVKQHNGEKRDIKPTIVQQTAQARDGFFGRNVADTYKVLSQNIDNWDRLTSTATRKQGYIITGNLLKALTELRKQGKGGKLISYTTDTGDVRQGILMSDQFDPKTLTSKNPISSAKEDLYDWSKDRKIVSADKDVEVRNDGGGWYQLKVPKSKKKGEKYFNDQTLLDLVSGQFEGSSRMAADFREENLDAILKRLDELGITVESTKEEGGNSGDKLNIIDLDDPMEAIEATAEQWRADNEEKLNNQGKSTNNRNKNVSLPQNNRNGKERGENTESRKGGLEESESSNRLSRRTRTILDRVANQLGIRIRVNDREEGADSGGMWSSDTRTITLSVDTANDTHKAIMKVFGHELTHAIKQMSEDYPEVWDAFVAVIKERIGEEKWKELFDSYRRAYDKAHEKRGMKKLDDAGVEEEICAEVAGEGIFTDEKFVKDLIDRVDRENGDVQSFVDRMLDFIKDIVDRIKAILDINDSETLRDNVTLNMAKEIWGDMYQYAAEKQIAEHSQDKLSVITDQKLIDRLENEPKITTYRAMKKIDGGYYAPMATNDAKTKKLGERSEKGVWMQSDEAPEKAFSKKNANGEDVWYFRLQKSEKSGDYVDARYNPYIHSSSTMLNDQFKSAETHPDLVVVELEIPESELTSGYKADKAKDSVGMLPWTAGTIQKQLTGTRQVMLSRYAKIKREVPLDEYAKHVANLVKGQVELFPSGIVTPEQRKALEKEGIKFVKTNGQLVIQEGEHKGENYEQVYAKKADKPKKKSKAQPRERLHINVDADPMEAIRNSASQYRRDRAASEGMTPEAHSAKAVYNERLNRVETVFSEAYQDGMVSLKTAQNAIAKDKEIPDSQNAYMAENLMHGKNKNEQDLYNMKYRDPLIQTINTIMNLTGMNWGDIDRYVYTKSGLERNREFYVRDWLEKERIRSISRYEDLNDTEQSIYDVFAARIEEDFEDGTIATEEEKQKKLSQALQKAHTEYVNQMEDEYQRIKSGKYQDLQDGVIDFPEYLEAIDDFIRRTIDDDYNPSEHDYSGFRAMFGDENGKYDEADVIEELMDTENVMAWRDDTTGDMYTDRLWDQIREATRYGLERYRESGMRSDEQIDRVEQMFHWYVPMRGFKDDTGEDMYQYFTGKAKSKSYVGGLLKHAKGRGSEANYPISTIFAMTYKAIADCNQNLVCQKLYRLCQANPNDLIVLSDSWAVFNEITGEWEESAPEIPEDATEEDVREATLAWEEKMRQLAMENKAKKIKGKGHFDYKPMDKKKQSEHIVDVRINGQPRKMIVTGNPRMAQALNGQLRFENGKNIFSKWNAAIKNMMASLFTSYSPTFALRNMARDWTHFRMMLGVREGHGYAKQANKYYRQSLFKMVGLFKKYREGTLDESKEIERDFKDFMDNGGITGFVQMQKIDDIQKQMEKLYKQQKQGKTIRLNNKVWDYTLGAIEALNEGIENNARFATFRASRHYAQRTKARSAYDAKEITVNFNRKGAGGKTYGFKSTNKRVEDAAKAFGVTSQILGEGRIFFNATVQAIATTFKNFQNADGSLNKGYIAKWAAKYALPPFMFGLALPMINKMLAAALGGDDGDDDPYANLAEWTRRKNICFYIGNGNFITIPIGQELAAFLTLGDIVAGNTYAPDLKPVDRSWDDEILGVMNTFSPVDVDTKLTKGGLMEDPIDETIGRTFSVLAPLVAVQQNLGWTGRPIYREDRFKNDQYTPEYQMVYQSTNPVLVNASKLLHELGGGDDITRGKLEVNPAIIQYLWEQYTGGPGKVFSNTISIGKDAKDILSGNESDFNVRKVEGLKAFVQQGDDRTEYYRANAKYRKYKADAERLYDAVKGYEGDAAENPEYLLKLKQISKGEDFVRMQIIREADKTLSQINKAANKAEGKERKELRRLYNEQVNEIVRLLDEVGE